MLMFLMVPSPSKFLSFNLLLRAFGRIFCSPYKDIGKRSLNLLNYTWNLLDTEQEVENDDKGK